MKKAIISMFFLLVTMGLIAQASYQKGKESSVHIWVSETGSHGAGIAFLAYDFDRMVARDLNTGFQGTYKTVEIGEHVYTTENLKCFYQARWSVDFRWINWTDEAIAAITASYDPRSDETPLSTEAFQRLYGNWFTMDYGGISYVYPEMCEFRSEENGEVIEGWDLPTHKDILQLIGQSPRPTGNINLDLLDFTAGGSGIAPEGHITEWETHNFRNTSGLALTPLGGKEPGGPLTSQFYAHKKLSKIRLKNGYPTFNFYVAGSYYEPSDFHYGQVRFCRAKTTGELGYKMYVDNCTDVVIILASDEYTDYPELPIGLERGIALRYADINTQTVYKSWTEIKQEALEYYQAIPTLPLITPELVFPDCTGEADTAIKPDPYEKGGEGSVHIWISELGSHSIGIGFLAYDFDYMEPRDINTGFQGSYKTIGIGEYEYTSQNLKALYQDRWGSYYSGLNWTDQFIRDVTNSYPQVPGEVQLSVEEFRNYYGNWFTLLAAGISYMYPDFYEFKSSPNGRVIDGWELPSLDDILQMVGQAPRLSSNLATNLLEFMAAGKDGLPANYNTEWVNYTNTSGFSLTPLGSRGSNDITQTYLGDYVSSHKKLVKLRLKDPNHTFTLDVSNPNYSTNDFHFCQVRYCRHLTDEELGYKMYIDEHSNRVVMLPYEVETTLPELAKGAERGIALRYTNREHMRVLRKWTDIQREAGDIRSVLINTGAVLPDDTVGENGFEYDRTDEDEGDNFEWDDDYWNNAGFINQLIYTHDESGNRILKQLFMDNRAAAVAGQSSLVKDIIADYNILIYPNPTQGLLRVETKDYNQDLDGRIAIFDMNGRIIKSVEIESQQTMIDINSQPPGIYIMHFLINGKRSAWRIIKE